MSTALVTGGTSGIGLALARRFARAGQDLVLVARGQERLERIAAELSAEHRVAVHVVAADLAEPSGAGFVAAFVARRGLAVETLVNSAGVGLAGAFAAADVARIIALLRVNIEALVALTRLLLPPMVAAGRGRVANLSSTAAFQPGPGMAAYYASKAFVLSFSEALAHEVRGSGVSVTAVCPGPVSTGFQRAAGFPPERGPRALLRLSADRVAEVAYRGIVRGRRVVVPGWLNRVVVTGARLMPRRLTAGLVGLVNRPMSG